MEMEKYNIWLIKIQFRRVNHSTLFPCSICKALFFPLSLLRCNDISYTFGLVISTNNNILRCFCKYYQVMLREASMLITSNYSKQRLNKYYDSLHND